MNYETAVQSLLERQRIKKKPSLDNVRAVLARLGNPHKALRCIHVTGTNGKGSVATLLAETLSLSGYRTALYTSPHLVDMRERMRVDGVSITREDFAEAVRAVAETEKEPLTFFEAMTCAAFLYFAGKGVDCAVVEVGIGGRLDTTNVIENPIVSIITSVALDHALLLGSDVESVAAEKSGIIKPGRPCVCGPLPEAARTIVSAAADSAGASLRYVERAEAFPVRSLDWDNGYQDIVTPYGPGRLHLMGAHQSLNAAVVCAALKEVRKELSRVSDAAFLGAMEKVRVPGRFQTVRTGSSLVILDGGHNPEAAQSLASTLSASPYSGEGLCVLLGVLQDKDYRSIVAALAPHLGKVIVTAPVSPRALDPMLLGDIVAEVSPMADIDVYSDPSVALKSALRFPRVLVTGSFYLVGEMLENLKANVCLL